MRAEEIGLTEDELIEIIDIFKSIPSIEEAILYGSRAKGNYKPFSDLDITLKGKELGTGELSLLDNKFYYSYLPYTFDISIYSRLKNPELINHIDRVGINLLKANSF